jgi:sec-independent protein translocase protein TatA
MPGGWEWLIIIGVLVLLFGAKRLPDMARSVGQSARVFKGEMKGLKDEEGRNAAPSAGTRAGDRPASSATPSSATPSSATPSSPTPSSPAPAEPAPLPPVDRQVNGSPGVGAGGQQPSDPER